MGELRLRRHVESAAKKGGPLLVPLVTKPNPVWGAITKYLAIHLFDPLRGRNRRIWETGDPDKPKNKPKENIMKQLLAIIFAATLLVAYAQAQTSTSSTTTSGANDTTTSQPTTTSQTTSTTDNSGTVTEYTPGAAITLDPGTGRPVHFIIGPKVQIVGPDGKVLAATDLKKNAKVHVRVVQEGDRTVVDKISVDNAP
jgi:hypothetical protein